MSFPCFCCKYRSEQFPFYINFFVFGLFLLLLLLLLRIINFIKALLYFQAIQRTLFSVVHVRVEQNSNFLFFFCIN